MSDLPANHAVLLFHTIPAAEANEKFEAFLNSFEISVEVTHAYHKILEDVFNSSEQHRQTDKIKFEKEIEILDKKISSIQMKLADDAISPLDYKEIKSTLDNQKNDLKGKLAAFNGLDREFPKYVSNGLTLLSNLSGFYSAALPETKSKIIGSIFTESLIYEEKNYRTTKMNDVFALICSPDKGFRKEKPGKNAGLSSVAPPSGLEPETL